MDAVQNFKNESPSIRDTIKLIKSHGCLLFFALIVVTGMVLGIMCVNFVNLETLKNLDILFCSDFDNRIAEPIWYTFISSLSSSFIFWIVMISVSASFLGPILVPMVLAFRSTGIGISAGYLYLIYEFKGVAFYILVLLPGLLISCLAFIFMAVYSFKFSLKVSNSFLPNSTQQKLWPEVIPYMKKSGQTLVILAISSLLDTACMFLFSRMFSF